MTSTRTSTFEGSAVKLHSTLRRRQSMNAAPAHCPFSYFSGSADKSGVFAASCRSSVFDYPRFNGLSVSHPLSACEGEGAEARLRAGLSPTAQPERTDRPRRGREERERVASDDRPPVCHRRVGSQLHPADGLLSAVQDYPCRHRYRVVEVLSQRSAVEAAHRAGRRDPPTGRPGLERLSPGQRGHLTGGGPAPLADSKDKEDVAAIFENHETGQVCEGWTPHRFHPDYSNKQYAVLFGRAATLSRLRI